MQPQNSCNKRILFSCSRAPHAVVCIICRSRGDTTSSAKHSFLYPARDGQPDPSWPDRFADVSRKLSTNWSAIGPPLTHVQPQKAQHGRKPNSDLQAPRVPATAGPGNVTCGSHLGNNQRAWYSQSVSMWLYGRIGRSCDSTLRRLVKLPVLRQLLHLSGRTSGLTSADWVERGSTAGVMLCSLGEMCCYNACCLQHGGTPG